MYDVNAEMVVPEVDKKLLEELESMGFSTTGYAGASSLW